MNDVHIARADDFCRELTRLARQRLRQFVWIASLYPTRLGGGDGGDEVQTVLATSTATFTYSPSPDVKMGFFDHRFV